MPSVKDTTQQVNETFPQTNFTPKPGSPLKTVLLIFVGLVFVSASAFAGFWYGKNSQAPVSTEKEATPSTEKVPAEIDETAGWKKFSEADLVKFELSVPAMWTWSIRNYTGYTYSVGFWESGKELDYIDLTISDAPAKTCDKQRVYWADSATSTGVESISVGGLLGWKFTLPGGQNPSQDIVCLEKEGVQFNFQMFPGTKAELPDKTALRYQILSTFKFTNDGMQQGNVGFFNFEGNLTLTGYLKIENRSCAFSEDASCKVDYAMFVVSKASNPNFSSWMQEIAGNSFVGPSSIGLGCYEKGNSRIYSTNDSDVGSATNIVSGSDLQRLLASSQSNQLDVEVTHKKFSGGTSAPDCYSHFRNFKVL